MKVGDYVRTVGGFIGKVISKKGSCTTYRIPNMQEDDALEIIKSSPNIIDLIEENDFINGLRVEKNKYGELYTSYVYYGGDIGKQCEVYTTWLKEYTEDMIENIVTHEQFERMQYNLESEVN